MVLVRVGLHWLRMVVEETVPSPPVRLIENQSADMLNPSRKVGVSTTPPEMVRATSGLRLRLPVRRVMYVTLCWVLGSLVELVLTVAGENRSLSCGARMSTGQVVRSLMSSVTWLLAPSFQVSINPEVE